MRPERLRSGVAALGERYRVITGDSVLARDGYLAGDDDRRADELNGYLRDPDVRGVVLARGGYGLMRILDRLDADALRRDPKVIVGYSDATALLCWALVRAGVRAIHGPMAAHFAELGAADRAHLFRLLEDPAPVGRLPGSFVAGGGPGSGRVSGPLLGGNLCLLSHLTGTPYQLRFGGAILFFEDVGERPYRIDRCLTHLGLAGSLAGVRAALVGDLLRCDEPSDPSDADARDAMNAATVASERLARHGIPALSELPFGHGERNFALPFGGVAEVDLDAATVTLLEGAVA